MDEQLAVITGIGHSLPFGRERPIPETLGDIKKMNWINQIFLLTLVFSTAFVQIENQTETEKLIDTIINSNVDLKGKAYVVHNKLRELDTSEFSFIIKKYELNCASNEIILKKIALQLITDNEIQKYKNLADGLNKIITEPFEQKNGFSLISEDINKEFCEFTRPLYSADKKYALVKFEVFSGFMFGSFSRTYLMEKANGKWIENTILQLTED